MRSATRSIVFGLLGAAAIVFMLSCSAGKAPNFPTEAEFTPAEDSIGERLFLDTRFAQYFATHMTGVNQPLTAGDPVVDLVHTTNGTLPGPFAGQSINCRSCHFVTEFQGVSGAGNRTYSDYTTRSPLPRVLNSFDHTPRNSMQMVGSLQPHTGPTFLHFDGEFASPIDLVEATLTGRNFGWASNQHDQALAHIASIIRGDDGSDQLAKDRTFGYSYGKLFLGTDPGIPSDVLIPAADRIDVSKASDQQILKLVAKCISTYMGDLLFQQDEFGRYIGSPYDVFLRINHLPVQPNGGETIPQYNQRLAKILDGLTTPTFVDGKYGSFQYHAQPFQFGATELAGLRIFLRVAKAPPTVPSMPETASLATRRQTFRIFPSTTQGYRKRNTTPPMGPALLSALPSLQRRSEIRTTIFICRVTVNHPTASERFRHAAVAGSPQFADLGLWNVYLNPDMPKPQANIKSVICATGQDCSLDHGLGNTVARFKTPVLRDLEDSAPYFHNGSKARFDDVVEFYINSSQLARQGLLRNAPAEFQGMSLSQDDVEALVAFLKSLTEDYDDA